MSLSHMTRVQFRFATLSGFCLLTTAAVIVIIATMEMRIIAGGARSESLASAKAHALALAEERASHAQAYVGAAQETVRTLAETLSGVQANSGKKLELDREEVNAILMILLRRNDQYLSTFTAWEVDAFDGLDAIYSGSQGHDDTGRLIPYWLRDASGEPTCRPGDCAQPGNACYETPRDHGRAWVSNAVTLMPEHPTLPLVRLTIPIMTGERFLGVTGIDLSIAPFQPIADTPSPAFDGKTSTCLIDANGTILARSGAAATVGQNIATHDQAWTTIKAAMAAGVATVVDLDQRIVAATPVKIPGLAQPWWSLIDIPAAAITAGADERDREAGLALWQMVIASISVAAVAQFLQWWLAGRITLPINRVGRGLKHNASDVNTAAGSIAAASEEVSDQTANEAAAIEQANASLAQIAQMAGQNADGAERADALMHATEDIVNRAATTMSDLTQAMENILAASTETAGIVKTINDIAFQTNLLALNAAVEAARAGEAGAGFAVVAEEVRNLASRAAQAANDSNARIEQTVERVNTGNQLVSATSDAFNEVNRSVQEVANLVRDIASASHDQSKAVDEMKMMAGELDKISQRNSASAHTSAEEAKRLLDQAQQLERYVVELGTIVGMVNMIGRPVAEEDHRPAGPALPGRRS